jgi:hypothetical protein
MIEGLVGLKAGEFRGEIEGLWGNISLLNDTMS